MSTTIRIPDGEYAQRVQRAAQAVAERGFDALLVCGSEGDFQNVRYFTGVTPVWERLGVVITADGRAAMLTGPEGLTYCRHFSRVDTVIPLNSFRSSMDPIPGKFVIGSFAAVFRSLGLRDARLHIALGNPIDTTQSLSWKRFGRRCRWPASAMRRKSCGCCVPKRAKRRSPV